jgi:hypothetical protein
VRREYKVPFRTLLPVHASEDRESQSIDLAALADYGKGIGATNRIVRSRSTAGRACCYPTGPGCASRAGVITSGNALKTLPPFARVPNLIAASENTPGPAGATRCDDA